MCFCEFCSRPVLGPPGARPAPSDSPQGPPLSLHTATPLLEGGVSPVGAPVRGGTRHIGPPAELETGVARLPRAAALGDFWPKMRQKRRESPSLGAAERAKGGRAGPGSRRLRRRCGQPCGRGGRGGAGGGGRTAPAPGSTRGEAAVSRGPAAPRGSFAFCHGAAATPGARLARSLTRARLLLSLRRRSPEEPDIWRVREPGREGAREGGSEGAPRLSLCPAARPSCYHRSAPGPRLHLGNLGRLWGLVWYLRGAAPARRGGGGGGEEEEEEKTLEKGECFQQSSLREHIPGSLQSGGDVFT